MGEPLNFGPEDGDSDISNGDSDRLGNEGTHTGTELLADGLESHSFSSSSNDV